jgi:3-dehydroquinate dehydratase I
MTTRRPVKRRPLLVGVIASPADLRCALALREASDLFELRLDCLLGILKQVERKMSILSAPAIITARDPREGGMGNLSARQRAELLLRFLPHARFVDVELRNARGFESLLERARTHRVQRILSFHDFKSTPSSRTLRAKAAEAKAHDADIFKVAVRIETPAALAQLVDLVIDEKLKIPLSAMGIGKLGAISRLLLARCGSALNYGSLQRTHVEGQLPIDVLRSALRG